MTRIAAIIPARMASLRFPGKPLFEIAGLPMVEHVRRRAVASQSFSDVVVATCDPAIAHSVESFGGDVLMTDLSHLTATDRIAEAMMSLDCTHVINVQGDEVLVLPSDLAKMAQSMQNNPTTSVWNAIAKLEQALELQDRSIVKCVVSKLGHLLYCARDLSSLRFPEASFEPIHWVVGILGYRRAILEAWNQLERTALEKIESIEQLRFLEYGIPIHAVRFEKAYPGVNEPREIELVDQYLKEDPLQREILEEILR